MLFISNSSNTMSNTSLKYSKRLRKSSATSETEHKKESKIYLETSSFKESKIYLETSSFTSNTLLYKHLLLCELMYKYSLKVLQK